MNPVDDCELPPRPIARKCSKPPFTSCVPQRLSEANQARLAVSWRLSRSSGSVRSKYGALKCRPPGATRPIVRNGESVSVVLVLPKRGWLALRENCAVAKKRFDSTPLQFVTNRLPG